MQGSEDDSANTRTRSLTEEELFGRKQGNTSVLDRGQLSLGMEHPAEQTTMTDEIPLLMDVLFRGEDSVSQQWDEAELLLPKGIMMKPLDLDLDASDLPLLTDLIPRSQAEEVTATTTELWRGVARDILAPKPPINSTPAFAASNGPTTGKPAVSSGSWIGHAPAVMPEVADPFDFEALSKRLQDELRTTLQIELERATGDITKHVLDIVTKHMLIMLRQMVADLSVNTNQIEKTATFTRTPPVSNASGEHSR